MTGNPFLSKQHKDGDTADIRENETPAPLNTTSRVNLKPALPLPGSEEDAVSSASS